MKTKIILLFLTHLSTYYFSFSQTSEHLTFKGIPIDGTLKEYVSKMTQNGYSNLNTDDGKILLNGDFAGYTNCKVRVIELKQKDLVHKIDVKFPDLQTWSTLSGNYFELKDMLTDKKSIDISELPNGIYFIEIQTDSGKYSQKLIIQH